MISVIIPVLNESKTIGSVVHFAKKQKGVSEVIVVDDGSIDGTPELARFAGAKVITSSMLGKGASMADGMAIAKNDWIVFLDGDLQGLAPDLVERLTYPLRAKRSSFVKAKFKREAGRVTTLTAKPLIQIFFPELSSIDQPLGGIVAARKTLLAKICLETDYGVDLGLLIDVAMLGEPVAEVDIGSIQHEGQTLQDLSKMASQVTRTMLHRAAKYDRLTIEQLLEFEESERRMKAKLSKSIMPPHRLQRIALFDMDGTLLQGRFISQLAKYTGKEQELARYLDHSSMHPVARTQAIARVFKNVPMDVFVTVAKQIPLMDDAVETIRSLRQLGYQVGIVTDSFQVAADTIRRRVFADFSLAHLMKFQGGFATGEVELCPSMIDKNGCVEHFLCKKNAVLQIARTMGVATNDMLAVGDGENDICMLRTVGTGIAFRPKTEMVRQAADHIIDGSLLDMISVVSRCHTQLNSIQLPMTPSLLREPKINRSTHAPHHSRNVSHFPELKDLTRDITGSHDARGLNPFSMGSNPLSKHAS